MRNLDIFRGEIPLRVRKKSRRLSGGLLGKDRKGKDGERRDEGRTEKEMGFRKILMT